MFNQVSDKNNQRSEFNPLGSIWDVYFHKSTNEKSTTQEYSSANTARLQLPRTFKIMSSCGMLRGNPKLLDLGCGSGNNRFKANLCDLGVQYYGCDPFNQSQNVNINAIKNCSNGQSDIVVINNVLNTVKERSVWNGILNQAKNSVNKKTGIVLIITYEGEKNAAEKAIEKSGKIKIKELPPLITRDGFQHRIKTEKYLDAVCEVFDNAKCINMGKNGGKVIVASVSSTVNLDLINMI